MASREKCNASDIQLSKRLVKNIMTLLEQSSLTQVEIAALAKIPLTTFNGVIMGAPANPKLHTLAAIAKVFGVRIAQLIGEMPLNFAESTVPLLCWNDLDVKEKTVNQRIDERTQFLSYNLATDNLVFALHIDSKISKAYKDNSIIIVEETKKYNNNDFVIISINNCEPTIKKIIKKDEEIFLESITAKLPIQQYDPQIAYIFGVIRETRF